jgi:hypothetical protein
MWMFVDSTGVYFGGRGFATLMPRRLPISGNVGLSEIGIMSYIYRIFPHLCR